MKIGVPALSRHSFFVWLFQKKRIWRVYYAGIVVLSNRGCINCKGRSRICFYNNITLTGFRVALILLFYNNITPTGFNGGVDSFLLQYYRPYGVFGGVEPFRL